MTNYVFHSLRSEQSQIDTLLEVLEDNGHDLTHQQTEGIEALDSFEYFSSLDIGLDDCDDDAILEAVRERINEAVLEISTTTTKRILLGCGGPTRYIEIDFDGSGEVDGGRYVDTEPALRERDSETMRTLTVSEAQAFADRYCLGDF
jgi:hypothetical protein